MSDYIAQGCAKDKTTQMTKQKADKTRRFTREIASYLLLPGHLKTPIVSQTIFTFTTFCAYY